MDLTFLDASTPLESYPAGIDGLAFYIGGDTPHVWTLAEENACPYDLRLPIFVRSNPESVSISADIMTCLSQLAAFSVPKGSLIALDFETAIDSAYVQGFKAGLSAAEYALILYGSTSTLFQNSAPLYWAADPTGFPHLYPNSQMTQYAGFQSYDESVAISTLPFWRKVPAVTTPPLPAGTVPLVESVTTQTAQVQSGFSFCTKCGAVYFRAAGNNVCPAGGTHAGGPADGTSYDYTLVHV